MAASFGCGQGLVPVGGSPLGREHDPRWQTGHGLGRVQVGAKPATAGPLWDRTTQPPCLSLLGVMAAGWLLRQRNRHTIIHTCEFDTLTPAVILRLVCRNRKRVVDGMLRLGLLGEEPLVRDGFTSMSLPLSVQAELPCKWQRRGILS